MVICPPIAFSRWSLVLTTNLRIRLLLFNPLNVCVANEVPMERSLKAKHVRNSLRDFLSICGKPNTRTLIRNSRRFSFVRIVSFINDTRIGLTLGSKRLESSLVPSVCSNGAPIKIGTSNIMSFNSVLRVFVSARSTVSPPSPFVLPQRPSCPLFLILPKAHSTRKDVHTHQKTSVGDAISLIMRQLASNPCRN